MRRVRRNIEDDHEHTALLIASRISYSTQTQLERLSQLAKATKRNEAGILREALDDVLKKYNDRLNA
jgi:predicted DNA-binding protein